MVRLLPANHPYLNQENIGKYGIRHVIAAALHELKFSWKNLDQIIIFFALLAGSSALLVYIAATLLFLLVSPVMAGWFVHPAPSTDISFIMLDRVFGVGGVFNSEVTTNLAKWGPFPNGFQVGLISLFQFYSMALFLLSVLIFLYFLLTIVAETSITGTPFGHRFDNFWIPIRVIAALGLLMPAFNGLNSAQYIVLYTAKYGASIATNAWIVYNLNAGDSPVGLLNKDVIAKPAIPDYSKLIKELIVIRGCLEMSLLGSPEFFGPAEFMVRGSYAEPLLDAPASFWPAFGVPPRSPNSEVLVAGVPFKPPYPSNPNLSDTTTIFYKAMNFYKGSDIRLVFGIHGTPRFDSYPGSIFPSCGEVVIPVTGQTPEALYAAEGYLATVIRILYSIPRDSAPAATIDPYEYALVHAAAKPYFDTSPGWEVYARSLFTPYPNAKCSWDSDNDNIVESPRGSTGTPLTVLGDCRGPIPAIYWVNLIKRYQEAFKWAPLAGYDFLTEDVVGEDMNFSIGNTGFSTLGFASPMALPFDTIRLGWGGAGVWYNKIAEKNGALLGAVGAAPYVVKYPFVMEKVKEQRLKSDAKVDQNACEAYNPNKAGITSLEMPDGRNQFGAESAAALYLLCTEVFKNESIRPTDVRASVQPNPIMNIINSLFGASTFFNVLDNKNVHPMAMLSNLGRTMIDKAIFNMMAATGASVVGGLNQMTLGQGDPGYAYITMAAANLSKAFTMFGTIALGSGVILYYVLPFLPFMYFFFAVGRWVKTIFEAMVGVPLWALAHLSLKGQGLPGTAASSGYFLILEIGIRPIVTVFALVASFGIFAALIAVLNTIFTMAMANIFGSDVATFKTFASATPDVKLPDVRAIVDQFFITLLYIILVYMTGTSCFKLIDIIPDNIMRWSGAGVRSWGASDTADDMVDSTGQMVAGGSIKIYRAAGGEINKIGDMAAADAARVIAQHAAKEKPPKNPEPGSPSAPAPSTGTGASTGVADAAARPRGQGGEVKAPGLDKPASVGTPPPPPPKPTKN